MVLNQLAGAADVVLTAKSDKSAYMVGENATFTGNLKNISQDSFIADGEVEYIFSVSQDGFEIWAWSRLECG